MELLQDTQKQYKDTDPDEKEKSSLKVIADKCKTAKKRTYK